MKIKRLILATLLCITSVLALQGQNFNNELRKGNNAYKERRYADAIAYYKKALKVDDSSAKAKFALADALYQKKQDSLAVQYYQEVLQDSLSREDKAEVLHNIGNIAMRKKDYKQAVDCYKKSLILNPDDDDTRYNLVLAQKLMPKDKQKKQNKNDQNKDNKDQQKDKQKPNKDKKNKDKDKKDPQNQKKKQDNQEKPKQDKAKNQDQSQKKEEQDLNKKQLEKLLDSYKANDEKTRKKVQKVQVYLKNKNKKKAKKKW